MRGKHICSCHRHCLRAAGFIGLHRLLHTPPQQEAPCFYMNEHGWDVRRLNGETVCIAQEKGKGMQSCLQCIPPAWHGIRHIIHWSCSALQCKERPPFEFYSHVGWSNNSGVDRSCITACSCKHTVKKHSLYIVAACWRPFNSHFVAFSFDRGYSWQKCLICW